MVDDPNSKSSLGSLIQAESVVQIALAIPAGCFVGLLIGYFLDKHFHTHWMVLAGIFLGAAGGFIQVFSYVNRLSKREPKDELPGDGL